MRCAIIVLSLAIIYASASPIADSVVPEESLYALDDDLAEAQQTVNQMTAAGRSDKDCRKLVEDTRKDVQTNVDSCQKIIDSMSKGEQCVELGQDDVAAATKAKSDAEKHVIQCTDEVTKANSAKVAVGSRTFSSLTEGKCETFFTSGAYTTASATYKAAVLKSNTAKGAAVEADKALEASVAAAAKAKHECECKTKADHKRDFATHSAADAANQKDWNYACKVECVLDHKTDCKCPAAPKCAAAKLTAAVNVAQCEKYVRGTSVTTTCNVLGMQPLATLAECEEAATALGLSDTSARTTGSSYRAKVPKGCYWEASRASNGPPGRRTLSGSTMGLWFNPTTKEDANGAAYNDFPICRRH